MDTRLNKIEVAEMQLKDAIIHFFYQGLSIISIHTLASSARQVLSDLCESKNVERDFEEKSGYHLLQKDKQKALTNAIRAPQNFAKHAENDPDSELEFNSQLTHLIIHDACQLYRNLTGKLFHEGKIFQSWMYKKYPDDFGGRGFLEAEYPSLSSLPDSSDFVGYKDLLKKNR